jgi:hypothetical protein
MREAAERLELPRRFAHYAAAMVYHQQTMVKVNAPVDEGIALLVSALSAIDDLETIESCQGHPGTGKAFVLFRLGSWHQCGSFLFDILWPAIPKDLRGIVSFTIRAYDSDNALASIEVDASALCDLTRCIADALSAVGTGVAVAGHAHS